MTNEELKKKIVQVMEENRECAFNVIDEIMLGTFMEVGEAVAEAGDDPFGDMKGRLSGFSKSLLQEVADHYADSSLEVWITGERRTDLQIAFLNYSQLTLKNFCEKYPRAYSKWSEDDDTQLASLYKEGAGWSEMTNLLQRNENALKIRLQKLGFDVPDAKPRFGR